jgi:hypothetical protein
LKSTGRTRATERSPSAAEPRFLRGLAFLVLFALAILLSLSRMFGDDDLFWHLATGKYIFEHGTVPDRDVFGYVTQGQPWIPFEWGWDLLTYWLHHLTGGMGVLFLLPILVAAAVCALLLALMHRLRISTPIILCLMLLTLVTMVDRLRPRPQIVTLLGLAVTAALYYDTRYFPRARAFRRLFLLPPVFLIWGNLHPGVLAGLLLLLLILAGEVAYHSLHHTNEASPASLPPPLPRAELRRLATVTGLCCLVLLVNPHGIRTYLYLLSHTRMKMLSTIREWISPWSGTVDGTGVLWAYRVLVGLGLACMVAAVRRKDPRPSLVYAGLAIYSARAVRFMGDFAVAGAVGTALALDNLAARPLLRHPRRSTAATSILLLAALGLVCAIPSNSFYKWIRYQRYCGFGLEPQSYCFPALDFVKRNQIQGRIFNQFEVGGLLVWALPGEMNFIDSRNLNDRISDEYDSIMAMRPGFERKLDQYGIEAVLLQPSGLLEDPGSMKATLIPYLWQRRDEWTLVYWDDLSLLYLRNLPRNQPVINQFAFRAVDPYTFSFHRALLDSLAAADPERVRREMDRKIQEEPGGYLTSLIARHLAGGTGAAQ